MHKNFKIEVPIYSTPLDHLIRINQQENISIILYGGVPNSPLNGGRFNYGMDSLSIRDRFFLQLSEEQLSKALSEFYKTITQANENNIPFLIFSCLRSHNNNHFVPAFPIRITP